MKNWILFSLLFLCLDRQLSAQDLAAAKRAFSSYELENKNIEKLKDAVRYVQQEPTGKHAGNAAYYQIRGEIYSEVASQVVKIRQTGSGSLEKLPQVDDPALIAFRSFSMALQQAKESRSPKKYQIKDALDGLRALQGVLYSSGIFAFDDSKSEASYEYFSAGLSAHELLQGAGTISALDDPKALQNQKFLIGLAALNAKKIGEARKYLVPLYRSGYEQPALYDAIYTIMASDANSDVNAAYKYLEEGRKKYPESVPLLFAEISHFLKINKLDELVGKLQTAIRKEPENTSLYTTLGNVYDNLYQRAYDAGDKAKSADYFKNAKVYYQQALAKDVRNFHALYSLGALYYNQASYISTEMKGMEDDLSPEGLEKYKAKEAEALIAFDNALPYFRKAETVDPNDTDTLIALKVISAYRGDWDTFDEMQKRIEVVKQGGRNASSYFR